jgi:outer membrane murein-binding lipoprotein Lpp
MFELKFAHRVVVTFVAVLLLAGCVSQQKYNTLDQQYQQL